jgi:hypothetical protein
MNTWRAQVAPIPGSPDPLIPPEASQGHVPHASGRAIRQAPVPLEVPFWAWGLLISARAITSRRDNVGRSRLIGLRLISYQAHKKRGDEASCSRYAKLSGVAIEFHMAN